MPVIPYPPDTGILFRGFLLGFSIAAPVGPIGVLCIRRTLAQGLAAGLVSGLGAATADAIYGSIAAFGVTAAGIRGAFPLLPGFQDTDCPAHAGRAGAGYGAGQAAKRLPVNLHPNAD
jgi:hypothetical protein